MNELLDLVVRATLLLLTAVFIWRMMRGRSAQARSTWLRAVVVGLAALPILVWTGPQLRFNVPLAPQPEPILMATLADPAIAVPTGFAWGWLWAGVAALLIVRMVFGGLGLLRMWSRAQSADDDLRDELYRALAKLDVVRPVDLRVAAVGTPMTFGLRRACVVVPRDFAYWPEVHREAALMHEAAHIRRFDCGWQWLTTGIRAMLWCHPLVWWLAHTIRDEAELAADERVIQSGIEATDYATALVEIARTSLRAPAPSAGTALLRDGQLSRRVSSALQTRRGGFTSAGSFGLMAAAMASVVTVAGLRPELPRADVFVLRGPLNWTAVDLTPKFDDAPSDLSDIVVPIDAGLAPLPQLKKQASPKTPQTVFAKVTRSKSSSLKAAAVESDPKEIVVATATESKAATAVCDQQATLIVAVETSAPMPPMSGETRSVVVVTTAAPKAPVSGLAGKVRAESYAFYIGEGKDDQMKFKVHLEQLARKASPTDDEEFKRQMERLQRELIGSYFEVGHQQVLSEKAKLALEEARRAARRVVPISPPAVPDPFFNGQ